MRLQAVSATLIFRLLAMLAGFILFSGLAQAHEGHSHGHTRGTQLVEPHLQPAAVKSPQVDPKPAHAEFAHPQYAWPIAEVSADVSSTGTACLGGCCGYGLVSCAGSACCSAVLMPVRLEFAQPPDALLLSGYEDNRKVEAAPFGLERPPKA